MIRIDAQARYRGSTSALQPLAATTCSGSFAGIDEDDLPGLGIFLMHLRRIVAQLEGRITHVDEVADKYSLITQLLSSQQTTNS